MPFSEQYTYSSDSGRCEMYIYGGCGATDNLFPTESECQEACAPDQLISSRIADAPTVEACGLPIDQGVCRARKPKYAFNKDTGRCERFFYGGNLS